MLTYSAPPSPTVAYKDLLGYGVAHDVGRALQAVVAVQVEREAGVGVGVNGAKVDGEAVAGDDGASGDVEAIRAVVARLDAWLAPSACRVDGATVVITACGVWAVVRASGGVFEAVTEFGGSPEVVGTTDAPSEVAGWLNRRFGRALAAASRRRALAALCERLDGAESLSYSQVWVPLAGDRVPGVRVRHRDAPDRPITVVVFGSCGYMETRDGRSAGRLASDYDPLGAVEAIERRLTAAAS